MKNFTQKFIGLLSISFTIFLSQSYAQDLSVHINTSNKQVYFQNNVGFNLPIYDINLISSTPWGLTAPNGVTFDSFGCSTKTYGDGTTAYMCYTAGGTWSSHANGVYDLNGVPLYDGIHNNYLSFDYSSNSEPFEPTIIAGGGGDMAVSPGTDHIAYMAPEVIEYIYVEVQMGSGMQSIPVYIDGQLLEQDCAGTWNGSAVNDACGVCGGDNSSCLGCTSDWASNYDPTATLNDGSCELSGCTDQTALNYNQNATDDDGSCIALILGCMDEAAVNYDANANTDNGTCQPYTLADVEAAYADGVASVEVPECEEVATQNIPLNLPQGWSMFGYTCLESLDVVEAFSGVSGNIEIVKDEWGLAYLPAWGFSAFDNLEFGEGYQIKMLEGVTDFQFCTTIAGGASQEDLDAAYNLGYSEGAESVDITTDNEDAYHNGYAIGYTEAVASVTPEDGISQADVDAAYAEGAASVTPEDGITQADLDALAESYAGYTAPLNLQIGDLHKGGIVFQINEDGSGLVAAIEDFDANYNWYDAINTGGLVGIIAHQDVWDAPNTGWYLPSLDELVLMFNTIGSGGPEGNIGAFENTTYWSSTAWSPNTMFSFNHNNDGEFDLNDANQSNASQLYRVRVVRAF